MIILYKMIYQLIYHFIANIRAKSRLVKQQVHNCEYKNHNNLLSFPKIERESDNKQSSTPPPRKRSTR